MSSNSSRIEVPKEQESTLITSDDETRGLQKVSYNKIKEKNIVSPVLMYYCELYNHLKDTRERWGGGAFTPKEKSLTSFETQN
jgi:hypothetical protein